MKLRGSLGDAHKTSEDAGKLGLPQAATKTRGCVDATLILCDNAE